MKTKKKNCDNAANIVCIGTIYVVEFKSIFQGDGIVVIYVRTCAMYRRKLVHKQMLIRDNFLDCVAKKEGKQGKRNKYKNSI